MFKKAFSSKKEIKEFKEKYSNLDVETEVISNTLQPYYQEKYPEIKSYCDFWWPEDNSKCGLTQVLKMQIIGFSKVALESEFGKYDFIFHGNRKYQNYILEFENTLFVLPSKREIVLNEEINKEIVEKMLRFENTFDQFVFSYVFKNYDNLESYEKELIDQMIQIGLIDERGNISFKSSKKTPRLK